MTNRPLPPEIYRRRRIAALVLAIALILVIAGVVRWVAGGMGSDEGTDQAAETSESVTVSRDDGVENTSAPAGDSSEPYTTTDSAAPSEPADKDKDTCELADLNLKVTADSPNYGATNPRFALTLSNPTKADCKIDLDRDTLRFEVFDMTSYERIWSDLDCHDSEGSGTETIKAGGEVVYDVNWSRKTSAPGKCTESDRRDVGAGSYLVYGLVGDRNSDPYTFNIR
ncbi:hypothetical protein ACFORJ_09685 [Corynebacterium hansenii]|uniref:Secreted protein n=1 Tax=Corynebacterium hansenii TaxID=394964 RepID=A0ABV7ZRE4_9CORY|nr:hypothetical protein [Corynebacterium hansenii]WJZ01023.1 hypothetical protein CHAN_12190 [Corynebacterium hansenii]